MNERAREFDRPARALYVTALITGVIVLVPALGDVPALTGDEAWVGLRADAIAASGATPLTGMTPYTGPFHPLAAALFMRILGATVEALRLPTVVGTLVAVHLFFVAIRSVFDQRTAALSALLLVTLPSFAIFGRQALEVFALNPLLAAGALVLLLRRNPMATFGAGLLLALGVWNHLVFAPLAIAVAAGVAFLWSRGSFPGNLARLVAAGFACGLAPRALLALSGGAAPFEVQDRFAALELLGSRLLHWPALWLDVVHGDVVLRHVSGRVPITTPPIVPLLVVAGIAVLAHRSWKGRESATRTILVIAGTALLLFATCLATPANSTRYLLLPLWVAPLFAGRLFAIGWESSRRAVRVASLVVLSGVCILQLARIAAGIAAPLREGVAIEAFEMHGMEEGSNHYAETRPLYDALIESGTRRVVAEFFIGMPLAFHDLRADRLHVILLEDLPPGITIPLGEHDRIVVYNAGLRRASRDDFPGLEVVHETGAFLVLAAKQ